MSSYYEKLLATGEVKCIDEEIPFEIPATWEWCRLGDVIQLLSGRDLEPYHYNSDGIGIPYMTGASNFCHEELIVNRWTEVPVTVSHIGDLLITCKGTIGTMAFNNIGDIHIARQIMGISSSYVSLKYIKLCLEIHVAELQKAARSIIPGISRDDMLYAIIPLPPIEEQHRIVSKIREVLTYVERYTHSQTALHLLNESIKPLLRKSILQEAIQGKLVSQIEAEGTADELLEAIKEEKKRLVKEGKLKKSALTDSVIYKGDDNKYYEQIGKQCKDITEEIRFDLPEQWQWCRIGTLFMHNNGKQLNKGNTKGKFMDYITTSNLYWDGFVLENLKKMPFEDSEIERCMAIRGDLLVCEGGDIGRSCIWCYDFPIMLQNHIHKLRPYVKVCIEYFYYIFYFYNTAGLIGGKGIGIQGFSSKALHNTIVPLPPIEEQQRIVAQIERLFEQLK